MSHEQLQAKAFEVLDILTGMSLADAQEVFSRATGELMKSHIITPDHYQNSLSDWKRTYPEAFSIPLQTAG